MEKKTLIILFIVLWIANNAIWTGFFMKNKKYIEKGKKAEELENKVATM